MPGFQVSYFDSAGIAGAVSMNGSASVFPDPIWIVALLFVLILAWAALFGKKRRVGRSGYTIIEEKP